jgi:tRNA pseudouridine13 synthase
MLSGQQVVRNRFSRGLYLSAARAEIFNRVLAVRLRAGTWDTALAGDALILDGSRSYFVEEHITGEIAARVKQGDLHPSGPLWGAGEPPTRVGVLALENEVAAGLPELKAGLGGHRMRHARRPLRAIPGGLQARWLDAGTLQLRFSLPAGSYATALLREIVCYETGVD